MQTVLAVFAGYALGGEHVAAGPGLTPFVQDALDEIEYATGGPSTKWGLVRIQNGHPAPFPVPYVEVGNEDFFDKPGSYDGRFAQFYDAIRAKYPHIQILATAPVTRMSELAVGIFDSHVGQGQSPLMLLYRALTMLVVAGYNASMLSVAIDGPAGAGKSTVARQVASALGCTYVDTGAMYRAVAWAVIHRGLAPEDSEAVCGLAARLEIGLDRGCVYADEQDITGEIRTPEISDLTSRLSALPCVRERLADLQREMGRRGGVVMEGRDIGTVVLPNAEVKVFLTASLAERVRRRREELGAAGIALSSEQLEKDIVERDARDASRDAAPMVPASDAVPLVSDGLSVEEVVSRILVLCRQVGAKHE